MAENQEIKQHENKYFHIILNMADDDLDVYEYRLLGHYIRVGLTYEGTRTTANKTKMSVGKVVSTRNKLEEKGYITMQKPETQADTVIVTIVDRMAENVARYSKERSSGEQGVHIVNTRRSSGERKKNNSKKNQEEHIADEPQVAQKADKPRDRLFDGVALVCFGIKADEPTQSAVLKTNAARIGKLVKFLKEIDASPESLWKFKTWYCSKYQDAAIPQDVAKFSKHYNDFVQVVPRNASTASNPNSSANAARAMALAMQSNGDE